jgi:AcrR family transcriptional regulator
MTSTRDRKTAARIRAAALELFGSKGYDATSMRDLADQVGFTTAALYYHFTGKEALLASLVEPFLDELDELLDGAAAGGVPDRHRALLAGYLDLMMREVGIVRLLEGDPAVRGHPQIGPRHEKQNQRLRELVVDDGLDPAAQARAASALGALRAPVMRLSIDLQPIREGILAASLRTLDAGVHR